MTKKTTLEPIDEVYIIFHATNKIVHLCLICYRFLRSRDVHPYYLVSRCPVSRRQVSRFQSIHVFSRTWSLGVAR